MGGGERNNIGGKKEYVPTERREGFKKKEKASCKKEIVLREREEGEWGKKKV